MTQTIAFHIRVAKREDAISVQQFVFLTLCAYGIQPEPEGLDAPVVTFGLAGGDGSAHEFVAESCDGTIVGAIALSPTQQNAVAELSIFYVDGRYRGKGIGHSLLEHVIKVAKKYGFRQINLVTHTIFEHAIHLYEKFGWVRGPDPLSNGGPDRIYSLRIGDTAALMTTDDTSMA